MVSGLDGAGSDRWLSWGSSPPTWGAFINVRGSYELSHLEGTLLAAAGWRQGWNKHRTHSTQLSPHTPFPTKDHLSQDVSSTEAEKPQSGLIPSPLLFPQNSENEAAGGRAGDYSQVS